MIQRCGTCDYGKQAHRWKKGMVCMFHSLWVDDSRKAGSGSKRSRRGKQKFRSLMVRYTDICGYWIPIQEAHDAK